jgi:hypothetical protein
MEPYETDLSDDERRHRRMYRRMQPHLRDGATVAGLFSGCRLSRCRRARACLGRHPDAEIGSSPYKNFPPCITSPDLHRALVDSLTQMVDAGDEEMRDEGRSPQEIVQASKDYYHAMCNAADWPEDPLARITSPRNRGPGRKRRKTSGRAG